MPAPLPLDPIAEAHRQWIDHGWGEVADGMAVVWASRMLGETLPERVTGIDLFEQLLEVAARRGLSVYFLGATDAVLDDLMAEVGRRHPGLRVAGRRNGYFDEAEAAAVARAIDAARPDFLFVGISTPKKERFLAEWAPRMDVGVCHGVGGAFDVLAGKVSRAPDWMQRLGLEWLYRVIQEALTNVARHASARHVEVVLAEEMNRVVATIRDDGVGFDVEAVLASKERGLGLFGMQERMALVGGRLQLRSQPGRGTLVRAEVPVEPFRTAAMA